MPSESDAFDPKPYAAGLRRQNAREAACIQEGTERARAEAQTIARRIGGADPSAKAIYLFGSLAGDGPRHVNFDIDLALDGGDVYAAEAIAEDAEFSVDLVSLDRLPADMRDRIKAHGKVVYRRE